MYLRNLSAALFILKASAAIIDVFVGGLDSSGNTILQYNPSSVMANVGDSVVLTFGAHNHSAAQSAFASPCSPLQGGFFSGFMPVADGQTTDLPQFNIPITNTKPIWVYCSQTGHCGKGMVFAINAPTTGNTFQAFQAAALATAPPATAAASASNSSSASYGSSYGYGSTGSSSTSSSTSSGYGSTTGSASGLGTDNAASTTSNSTTPTTSGSPTVHTVVVGGSAGLVYTPSSISASAGDTISFQFQVKNHTATQSTFAAPCTPKSGGFNSGFMPVAATATDFPVWNLTVNDTTPIWVFCEQANHCESGMVFAVNAPSSGNTYDAFKAAAATATSGTTSTNSSSSSGYGSTGSSSSGAAGRLDAKFGAASLTMLALGFMMVL